MQVIDLEISNLRPYEKNARRHPQKQIDVLAKNIERFGFTTPVLVSEDNEVIAGHGRLLALKQLGRTEVPCVRMEGLTKEEIKALRLADNQIASMGEWDMGLAIEELKGLSDEMFDLTGFDKDLIIGPDEQDDIIPENAPPVAKLGDIWALGRHRVMCGDSMKKEDVAMLMGDKKADMVFTDPPYGVDYQKKTENIVNQRKNILPVANDNLGKDALKLIVFPAFQNIANNLKNGGVYYICSPQGGELGLMMMMMMDAGIECRHMIVWKKDRAVFSMGRLDYDYQHEPILYGWRGSHKHIGNGQYKTSVWDIPRPSASKLHPTMKPVELMVNAILNSTKEEDLVIDYFLGSGSTLIACEKTNRICYGMELDPKYVDVIIERYEQYTGTKAQKI